MRNKVRENTDIVFLRTLLRVGKHFANECSLVLITNTVLLVHLLCSALPLYPITQFC